MYIHVYCICAWTSHCLHTTCSLLLEGKKRRLTLIECGCDMNSMIDIGKVADLVS